MFSLLITLVSIALVVGLALASIYYLGDAFIRSNARASASTLLSQAEQLMGAARIFQSYEKQWPANLNALISANYLSSVPAARGSSWQSLSMSTPAYVLPSAVDVRTCRELNSIVRRDNGVHQEAVEQLPIQCFGTAEPYNLLVRAGGTAGLGPALGAAIPGAALVPAEDDAQWAATPT